MRAIIKNINWRLPSFYIPAEQECISTHKVRAQLGIEDDILRGLGMCLQQAKRARVRTGALLANLRSNNDCGLGAPLFSKEKRQYGRKKRERHCSR